MHARFTPSRLVVAALFALVLGATPATAEKIVTEHERGPGRYLIDHTLIFADEQGREHLIHFSRFGTFDWYFPCQFETGSWHLSADQLLRLTYDSSEFAPRTFHLARDDGGLFLSDPARETVTVARLQEGNRLPFG